jgi:uncharacterized protein Smg (DUF494 family)
MTIKKIELIASSRLSGDLAARGLNPDQIGKILQWLAAQTEPVIDRSKIEADLQSMGFSQEEVNGTLVSLVKESVRPHLGYYLIVILLGLFAIASCLHWLPS